MKSESGVTLVALITIIIVLIIIMSVGIYSGINSYKVIDIEKYKAQMQLIQNAVDELSEENKNNELKGKDAVVLGNNQDFDKIKKSFWNEDVAGKFGIDTNKEEGEYYCVSVEDLKKQFNLENIDISEYFVINFEKRYVFSVTPIEVVLSIDEEGNENKEKIYCLYQLDEEEKVIDFKTDGKFEYIIYKEENKQNIEIINNINIVKVEIDVGEGYVNIHTRKDYCPKITGLNTRKVTLEIVKNCKIKVTDTLENNDEREIILYNVPILRENMIPIIVQDKDNGKISYINDPKWYDYYIKDDKIDEYRINFAVAINAITSTNAIAGNTTGYDSNYNNYYKENVSDTVNTILKIPAENSNQSVKVWIPKNLREYVNNTYGTIYTEEDFEGTGMWVEAKWNGEKYVPANGN